LNNKTNNKNNFCPSSPLDNKDNKDSKDDKDNKDKFLLELNNLSKNNSIKINEKEKNNKENLEKNIIFNNENLIIENNNEINYNNNNIFRNNYSDFINNKKINDKIICKGISEFEYEKKDDNINNLNKKSQSEIIVNNNTIYNNSNLNVTSKFNQRKLNNNFMSTLDALIKK
jgi:hypothetical protein